MFWSQKDCFLLCSLVFWAVHESFTVAQHVGAEFSSTRPNLVCDPNSHGSSNVLAEYHPPPNLPAPDQARLRICWCYWKVEYVRFAPANVNQSCLTSSLNEMTLDKSRLRLENGTLIRNGDRYCAWSEPMDFEPFRDSLGSLALCSEVNGSSILSPIPVSRRVALAPGLADEQRYKVGYILKMF